MSSESKIDCFQDARNTSDPLTRQPKLVGLAISSHKRFFLGARRVVKEIIPFFNATETHRHNQGSALCQQRGPKINTEQ